MAWCHQASSHYLRQCWFRSLLVYGVTTPIWVNLQELGPISQSVDELINQIFWKFSSFHYNFKDSISPLLCTCHNSSAVVTCAKKWTDWSDNSCSYKSNLYIDNIWIRSSNIVVKWVADIILSVHACDVYLLVWFFMSLCALCTILHHNSLCNNKETQSQLKQLECLCSEIHHRPMITHTSGS